MLNPGCPSDFTQPFWLNFDGIMAKFIRGQSRARCNREASVGTLQAVLENFMRESQNRDLREFLKDCALCILI